MNRFPQMVWRSSVILQGLPWSWKVYKTRCQDRWLMKDHLVLSFKNTVSKVTEFSSFSWCSKISSRRDASFQQPAELLYLLGVWSHCLLYTLIDPCLFLHHCWSYLGHFKQKEAMCCKLFCKATASTGRFDGAHLDPVDWLHSFGSSGFFMFSSLVLDRQEFIHLKVPSNPNTFIILWFFCIRSYKYTCYRYFH